MGREIRMVPPNWENPRYTKEDAPCPEWIGDYRPMIDQAYDEALDEWLEGARLWSEGNHPDQPQAGTSTYDEWVGNKPQPEWHRPEYTEEPTWLQVYENVTEGTPVTPSFPSSEELVKYLVEHGDFWAQKSGTSPPSREAAERFVSEGYAPSFVMTISDRGERTFKKGVDAL